MAGTSPAMTENDMEISDWPFVSCEFGPGLRPTPLKETRCVQFTEPSRHGRACPGHPRRPLAPRRPIRSAPCRLSAWAACKSNHVDGRDKPGHDGKWHGKQDLTSLFLVSSDRPAAGPLG